MNRPMRIYQVELSAFCNMRCSYCPHPSMRRPKGFMSADVLAACIEHVKRGSNDRLVLHHFGEPLLHPKLRERLAQIRDAGLSVQLSTNAKSLERCWPVLLEAGIPVTVMISVHQWVQSGEAAYGDALARWQARSDGTRISVIPAYNVKHGRFVFHQWGEGENEPWDVARCPFLEHNLGCVLWNGDIVSCCVDHEGVTAKLNILKDGYDAHVSEGWSACGTCDVGRIMQGERW